ncbi:MED6-domain-containing protein [Dichomitus squalens]|uniref:Mediator of RNA polymerase II transcription subunit 6 n=1 Tax=Dichomitus squalens TaxID=114155 RepID=A0A4Q9N722_9APHY|nr:MED6-domain-containing protein [Dichomitus squalens]
MEVDLHPPDDYSHRFFIWHEWIQAHGPLTLENAFDYFTTSMFYDKQSNNQVLRMQTMHTGAPLVNEAEELKRFTGIEFALVHAEAPSLFIIHKRERLSPDEVRPLAVYFILNNRIYQSPDVYNLVSNRLLTSLHSLQKSLDILRAHRPAYTPRTGFAWPIVEPSSGDAAAKKRNMDVENAPETTQETEALSDARSTPAAANDTKRQQNNMLLFNAMRTTAVHARESFQLPAVLSEETVPETPATATVGRSSVTPAPAPVGIATRAPSIAPTPQEPTKGPSGGGKKKKKSKAQGSRPPTVSQFRANIIARYRNGDSSTSWVMIRVFPIHLDHQSRETSICA